MKTKKKKYVWFVPVGGFYAVETYCTSLKELLEVWGCKRKEISDWWKEREK